MHDDKMERHQFMSSFYLLTTVSNHQENVGLCQSDKKTHKYFSWNYKT